MSKTKTISSDGIENVDLVGEYLSEDPSILSPQQLQEIAKTFGLSNLEVQRMVRNMSSSRDEIRDQYGDSS